MKCIFTNGEVLDEFGYDTKIPGVYTCRGIIFTESDPIVKFDNGEQIPVACLTEEEVLSFIKEKMDTLIKTVSKKERLYTEDPECVDLITHLIQNPLSQYRATPDSVITMLEIEEEAGYNSIFDTMMEIPSVQEWYKKTLEIAKIEYDKDKDDDVTNSELKKVAQMLKDIIK